MLKNNLLSVTQHILFPADFHENLAPAVMDYHDLLCQAAEMDNESEQNRAHIQTSHGHAIGPFWAANCVKEIFRTQRFVRGLAQAITDLRKKGKQTVHVLYAGTGPFAALALPVMLSFDPSEVQFTLLEINESSYRELQKLLVKLDLMAYVRRLEMTDATNYLIKDKDIDILLSETMNLALYREPQVSIMLNIGRQVNEQVVYIPQAIKVTVCKRNLSNAIIRLKTLMQFDANYIREKIAVSPAGLWAFEKNRVEVALTTAERLYYLTEITIYNDFQLGLNDSSLTMLKEIRPQQLNGKLQLEFQYQISETPGFIFNMIK